MIDTAQFWETRAQRFARDGDGLRAVCSYASPSFYNRSIDWTQRRALLGLIKTIPADAEILEYGCGVGRWTCAIARRGARVTAVDFSETMLEVAANRVREARLQDRVVFIKSDVAGLDLGRRFDFILGVTVLQHVLEQQRLTQAIQGLAKHLKPGGRIVMLEAAPSSRTLHANTATFTARPLAVYLEAIQSAGLRIERVQGVDPAPFKVWFVPKLQRIPRPIAVPMLTLLSFCALPIDLLLARALTHFSWHKLIVAQAPGGAR
jgi:2-polyprenyl-3-methyl-5-hydroxy-6-metoxy-1,4-benzoquinol methylase